MTDKVIEAYNALDAKRVKEGASKSGSKKKP